MHQMRGFPQNTKIETNIQLSFQSFDSILFVLGVK